MSISDKFTLFCNNLRMSETTVFNIKYRVEQITKRINLDFWGIESGIRHSLYVGSYGRGTDIHTSDIDLIIELPFEMYSRYSNYIGNGQSALIQAVKDSIKKTYSSTYVRGDGQVVKLNFTDGICFEIVPAFLNSDGINYTYPDTNDGGSWKVTKPREEKNALNQLNIDSNKNLKRLCRMARAWKDQWNVPISGILLDTLAYRFMEQWSYSNNSYLYYDWMTRDFFKYLKDQNPEQYYWLAPGSKQYVWRSGNFEYKASKCYDLALKALEYEDKKMPYTANQTWREIYGNKFPA
ncbi:SMODS domain-containing nucleotidyltransferase [Acinetobacter calcoaceticus]|uniref:SMODS domain-containing nucleotidyltransferase n=1 Tax=Acinetobacter calcoaceticus TaxID=471 RepID=UPI00321B79B2